MATLNGLYLSLFIYNVVELGSFLRFLSLSRILWFEENIYVAEKWTSSGWQCGYWDSSSWVSGPLVYIFLQHHVRIILDCHVSPDPGHSGRNWLWWFHGEVEFMNYFPGLSEFQTAPKGPLDYSCCEINYILIKKFYEKFLKSLLLWNLKSHKILEHSCNFLLVSRFSNLSFGLQCISIFLHIIHVFFPLGLPVNQVHTLPGDSWLGIQGTSAIFKTQILWTNIWMPCVWWRLVTFSKFFDISPKIWPGK